MTRSEKRLLRHSLVALYHQLKRIMQSEIEEGTYEPGDQLPSENQLAEAYDVSRHVVRQALKALVSEGRIVAHQGSDHGLTDQELKMASIDNIWDGQYGIPGVETMVPLMLNI